MNPHTRLKKTAMRFLVFCFFFFKLSVALAARNDVLIIVNDNSIDSPQIGSYYAQQRGIDPANIVHINVPDSYFISWNDFRSLRDQLINFMQRNTLDDPNLVPAECIGGESPYYCQASMDQLRTHTRIRYLVTTRGVPTRMVVTGSTLFSASAPTSVDNYLKYWLVNYFSSDVSLGFNEREIAFGNGDGMRTIIPAIDRELIVGRIDGLDLNAAKAQIDRTIAIEKSGIYGTWYGSTQFWDWRNESTGLKVYPPQDSRFVGWRYGLGQWREDRPECVDYLNSSGFLPEGKAPSHCRIKFNDDFNVAIQSQQGTNYPAPGNSQSREPLVVDALGYQGWFDGQATLGSFNTMLNWRKNDQCAVALCNDASDPAACKAASTDIFGELNTDCVGLADGFMGYQHTSYPVSYLTIWPTGWQGPGSGDFFRLAFPEVRTDTGSDDNFSLWFRNTDQVVNPRCYSGSDFAQPASLSCNDTRKLQLRQTIQLGPTTLDVNNPPTYQISLNYQTVALNASTPLRVKMLVHETGAGATKIDYGFKTLATMAPGNAGWLAASVQFTLDPSKHSGTSYDRIELIFDTPVFSGELGIDAVSVVQTGVGAELALNGSFADGHLTVSAGDHAANFLNRLSGVAVWGSVGHHQSGGCAFCSNGLEIMTYFLRGLPLGDAVWFDESNNSGILYGDPLYSPVAVHLNPPDRLAIQSGSVDLFGSTVNGRDPLQVDTNYSIDICAANDFYICDQAGSWQATTISGTGGSENALLGTLDTTSLAADFVIRLQVNSVNTLSGSGKSQTIADYYTVFFNAPIATNSTLSLVEDPPSATSGQLIATDPDNEILTYSIVTNGNKGTVVITDASTGAYTYSPNANATGVDSFTFKVNDGVLESNIATVVIKYLLNDVPIATDSTLNLNEDVSASGILSAGDADNDTLTYSIVSNGASGTAVITNASTGDYVYTPNANTSGNDSFSFWVNDGLLDSNVATVTVTIVANDPPIAANSSLSTDEDVSASGILSASDIENNILTYSIVTGGSKGTVVITDASTGAYTYSPNANANGVDSFTFKANDGSQDSNIATVDIGITAVNDVPVAVDTALNVDEDIETSGILSAGDVDNDALTYSIVSKGANGTVVITDVSTGAYTYTPSANASGNDSFSFWVNDGLLDSNVATVTVTIVAVNDPPIAAASSLSTDEDVAKNGIFSAIDIENDALTYSVVTDGSKGTVAITDASTGTYTYTPNANTSGNDSFSFWVNDGLLDSNVATVTVTIVAVNDSPIAAASSLSTDEDVSAPGILSAGDIENNILTYSIVTNGGKGTVVITDASTGAYTYSPNANANGVDSFTFRANDGFLNSNIATVDINITAVNDVPVAVDTALNVDEDIATSGILSAGDADNDTLTYSIVTDGSKGTVVITNASTGAYTYTPNANTSGNDSFSFKVNDGLLDSAIAIVTVNIAPVNDVPIAADSTLNLNEDVSTPGILSAGDADNDTLTYSIVSNGASGTAVITNASTGAYTYTPNANTSGNDSFSFKANDGLLDSAIAIVTVNIAPVNDVPIATGSALNLNEDVSAAGILSAGDVDNDVLTYSIVSNGGSGTVVITNASTGAYTYTPSANTSGNGSFSFKVNDGLLDSKAATVTVTVVAVNDPPIAANSSLSTDEDVAQNGIFSAIDIENDILTYSIVTNGSKGTVEITDASTGAYTYMPNANTSGNDSFSFKVNDGLLDSAIATVTVNIAPVNDVPVAMDISFSIINNESITATLSAFDEDGDKLIYTIINNANKGTAVIDAGDGIYTYTPHPGATGTDSITYSVSDGLLDSNMATITIQLASFPEGDPGDSGGSSGGLNMLFVLLLFLLPGLRFFPVRRA